MSDQPADRRPRRRATGVAGSAAHDRTRAYRQLVNPYEPLRVFSDDHVAAIHEAALSILETQGMRVLSEPARRRYAAGGATVHEDSMMVRFDRALVTEALSTTPKGFTLHGRDPSRDQPMSGRHLSFACVSGPPNIMDVEGGRRAGTFADFKNLMKLCQSFEVITILGGGVEPQDIPVQIRHLDTTREMVNLTDKIPLVYARGTGQINDNFEMIRLAYGLTDEEFRSKAYATGVINTNSPLQLDIPMAEGLIDFALWGQPTIITPFTLAGAMAPVTIAGALTLAHAEALASITLTQIARKGAPVIYGSFTSNVDMKSGAPAFGTPEYSKAAFGAGQMARHIGLPWRSSNATASNSPDAQSAYESQMSLWGAIMGGCNFILHSAGWLEGGLSTSYEKFILDIEMLQMFAETFQPVSANPADLAVEAIAEVGPSGHFFGCAHTMERYRTAFYAPLVSDWSNYGQWSDAGALTATQRAQKIWRETLNNFVPPQRDPAIVEAIDAFVARRKEEGGAHPVS
jgi:trimethylamine--corrinoid protein Co-methyltransferase